MKTFALIGALIGATYLAFRNTIPGQFIYDDKSAIAYNPLIRDLRQIPLILGTSYWGTNIGEPNVAKGGLYRPLTVVTYALNYHFGNLSPRGYHIVNLALHLGVSILLGILGIRLGLSWQASWAAAFLFALLPIHTEAVSNVVGRSEILAAFFTLISWICVVGSPKKVYTTLGALAFAMALLSKENAMAFLPVLLISDYVFCDVSWKTLSRERLIVWVIYGGTALLYLEWKYLILGSIAYAGGVPYFLSRNLTTILLTTAQFTARHYVMPLVTGAGFCIDFTRPSFPDAHGNDLSAWMALLVLLGIVGHSFYRAIRYKSRAGLLMTVSFILLLPFLNLVAPLEVVGAERFLYLPSVGYCLILGLGFEKIRRFNNLGALAMFFGACAWYGFATFERNKIWESDQSFWTAAATEAPSSARAWNGLGLLKMDQKKYDEAIPLFIKAIRLNPLLVDAKHNIALSHFLQKHYDKAKNEFLQVVRESPFDVDALFHLAYIYDRERDYRAAAQYYAATLAVNPLDRASQRNLAVLHCRAGNMKACVEELHRYLQNAPPDEPNDDLRAFLKKVLVR